jgi:hypothetical protein
LLKGLRAVKRVLLLTALLATLATPAAAAPVDLAGVDPEVVLEVKLAPGATAPAGELERLAPGSTELARWYRLTLPPGADVQAKIDALLASGDVTAAYPAPAPAPPPQAAPTGDFTLAQGYLRPAPVGTDADFARADPRLRGTGVKIVDLEYYWTANHEDLQLDPIATDLGKTTYPQYPNFADEHGTAVFGVMVAKDNGFGVTGGVPDATMHGISPLNAAGAYVPAAALTYAGQFLAPGDVVLIEQQTVGPGGGAKYVPMEWVQSSFDAIRALSDQGIVVVETGGNGGEDLDSAPMLGRFDRSVRDSGAIIGGAGSSTAHAALSFSSYGTRVDLQGWGENVATTGGNGNLFDASPPGTRTRRYTASFNGTSSAGPVIVNAVVAVQSYLKATGQTPYTSAQLRELLRRTGTPQTGARPVGPLPNTRAALLEIEVDAPKVTLSVADRTVTVAAEDGWGTGVQTLEYRFRGGAWTPYTAPVAVPEGGAFEARATDGNGNAASASVDVPEPLPSPPAALSLTLGPAASFGTFTPGIDRTYTASTTLSATPGSHLEVSMPGQLVSETARLEQPVQVAVSASAVTFTQTISADEVLRTGTYSGTATFTLSTPTP